MKKMKLTSKKEVDIQEQRRQKNKELLEKISRSQDHKNKSESQVKALRDRRLPDSPLFWCILAIARVYLALSQTGYIHPDEFHQSLQVIAYDVLEIDGIKAWEFSSSSPIRSSVFLGMVSLPYIILKHISPAVKYLFSVDVLTPGMLIVAPRIFMTLLSFISDFCIFKIASMCYVRPWQCVEVFAGSYIMLVYSTRTFSNCIELILFSLLLWRVCLAMVESLKIIRKENVLQDLYESSESMKEKVKIVRLKSKLPPYNYVDSFIISVIVTLGVFVRPTFLLYSFIPLAYWLQRGIVTKELDFSYFNWRCASLLPGVMITFTSCILADSFYYSSLTFRELLYRNITVASFTVTPLNFLLYNTRGDNLAEHGFHPYLLHFAVNIPLLHGVLGLAGLWSVSKYFAHLILRPVTLKPKINSMATMLLCSFIVPVLTLSFIPHQEPRFLLPTLIPLVLLHSDKISIYALPKFRFTKHFLFLMWQVWNIVCVIFFGFLHQGGVTRSMVYIHDFVATQPPTAKFQVFFAHLYSPPTFLLMRKIPVIAITEDGRKYRVERSVTTHDLGSSLSPEEIFEELVEIGNVHEKKSYIILCITASLSRELKEVVPLNVSLQHVKRLAGHFSTESLPDFTIRDSDLTTECNKACHLAKRVKEFSVDIFKVEFANAQELDTKIPSDNSNDYSNHDEL